MRKKRLSLKRHADTLICFQSMATTYFREHLRHIIFSNPTPLSRVQYNSQMSSTAAALPSVGLLSTQWFWLGPIP